MARNVIAVFASAALAFGGTVVFSTTAHAGPTDPVVFADVNLEDAVNAALGQSPGDTITEAQAETLTSLTADNAGITLLGGIQYLTGLTSLDLSGNDISSLAPLAPSPAPQLLSLTHLDLSDNDISNLTPLAELPNLTHLDLHSNDINNLAVLSALGNLTHLNLDNNDIDNLVNLTGLTGLIELHLGENSISDVVPLSGMTSLTELHLYDNSISDVSALSGLTSLDILWLAGNSISDVSPLSGLTNLTRLGLDDNSISTLPVLTGLTSLTELYLNVNSISDVSPLSGLTTLTGLHLNTNRISDVSPLSGLTNLTELYVSGQSVSMSPAVVSQSTANPVVDAAGAAVPVSSTDTSFVFNAALNEWMFTTVGTKTVTWSTSVTVGNAPATTFSGTITQEVNVQLAQTGADPVMTIFGGVLGSLLLVAGAVAVRRRITAH